uniref:Uncharacterized protein n=1 Tax=Anopheles dirus TaxID=7168 RepID=A0A182N030_9DIPT
MNDEEGRLCRLKHLSNVTQNVQIDCRYGGAGEVAPPCSSGPGAPAPSSGGLIVATHGRCPLPVTRTAISRWSKVSCGSLPPPPDSPDVVLVLLVLRRFRLILGALTFTGARSRRYCRSPTGAPSLHRRCTAGEAIKSFTVGRRVATNKPNACAGDTPGDASRPRCLALSLRQNNNNTP